MTTLVYFTVERIENNNNVIYLFKNNDRSFSCPLRERSFVREDIIRAHTLLRDISKGLDNDQLSKEHEKAYFRLDAMDEVCYYLLGPKLLDGGCKIEDLNPLQKGLCSIVIEQVEKYWNKFVLKARRINYFDISVTEIESITTYEMSYEFNDKNSMKRFVFKPSLEAVDKVLKASGHDAKHLKNKIDISEKLKNIVGTANKKGWDTLGKDAKEIVELFTTFIHYFFLIDFDYNSSLNRIVFSILYNETMKYWEKVNVQTGSGPDCPVTDNRNISDDTFIKEQGLRIKKLSNNATLPKRANDTDAGADLYSAEDRVVPSKGRCLVLTDIAIALPKDTYGRVAPRSSLAMKGIDVAAGVIDRSYRGNIGILLVNHSTTDYQVKKGDRIAQLIVEVIKIPEIFEVSELETTARGDGGFGSTGV